MVDWKVMADFIKLSQRYFIGLENHASKFISEYSLNRKYRKANSEALSRNHPSVVACISSLANLKKQLLRNECVPSILHM